MVVEHEHATWAQFLLVVRGAESRESTADDNEVVSLTSIRRSPPRGIAA
jgi:hypothetical protein